MCAAGRYHQRSPDSLTESCRAKPLRLLPYHDLREQCGVIQSLAQRIPGFARHRRKVLP
jgi:hypothetical protein